MPRPLPDGISYESDDGDVLPLADLIDPSSVETEPSSLEKTNSAFERVVALAGIRPPMPEAAKSAQAPDQLTPYDKWYSHVEALMDQGVDRDRAINQVTSKWGPQPPDETEVVSKKPEEARLYGLRVRIQAVREDPLLNDRQKQVAENELLARYRAEEERRHEFYPDYVYVPPEI